MTDNEKQLAWDGGFKAYWDKQPQSDCPENEQELRDEWMDGWFTAQSADTNGI